MASWVVLWAVIGLVLIPSASPLRRLHAGSASSGGSAAGLLPALRCVDAPLRRLMTARRRYMERAKVPGRDPADPHSPGLGGGDVVNGAKGSLIGSWRCHVAPESGGVPPARTDGSTRGPAA